MEKYATKVGLPAKRALIADTGMVLEMKTLPRSQGSVTSTPSETHTPNSDKSTV